MRPGQSSSPSFFLFVLLGGIYMWATAPGILWYDSGELALAAATLGNGHPPGQPLYALLGRLAMFVPLGSLAWRLGVLSALGAAAAVALIPGIFVRLCRLGGLPEGSPFLRWVLAPSAGLSLAIRLQAVRVELYSVQLFLSLLAIRLALDVCEASRADPRTPVSRGARIKAMMIGGMVIGLGMDIHPLLSVLIVPGLLWLIGPVLVVSRPGWTIAAAVVAGGMYLMGPIRSAASPVLDWGHPADLSAWWAVITGKAYQRSFIQLTGSRFVHNLELHLQLFRELLGGAYLILGALGLIHLLKRPRLGIGVLLIGAGALSATASQSLFSPDNPDALGYLALPFAMVSLLAAHGAAWLIDLGGRARFPLRPAFLSWVGATLSIGLTLLPVLRAWPWRDVGGDWTADRFGHTLLRSIPPGSLYISGADSSTFPAWYAKSIGGSGPGIDIVGAYVAGPSPPFRTALTRRSAVGSHRESLRALIEDELPGRAVYMSANDLELGLRDRLRPGRMAFRIVSAETLSPLDEGLDPILKWWAREAERWMADRSYLLDARARLVYPAHLEALGDHFIELGLLDQALACYRHAQQWDPDPSRLVRLKRARLEETMRSLPTPPPLSLLGKADAPDAAARIGAAEKALALGRHEDAARWIEGIEEDGIPALAGRLALARARIAWMEGDRESARRWLLRLRDGEPPPELSDVLARLHPIFDEETALRWIAAVLREHPTPELLAALAERLPCGPGKPTPIALGLQRGVEANPSNVHLRVAYGQCLLDEGRLFDARAQLQHALDVDPVDPKALRLASRLYRRGLP